MKMQEKLLALLLAMLTVLPCALFAAPAASFADESPYGENVALGKDAYANDNKLKAKTVTDGNPDTFWNAVGVPLYAEVDLGAEYKVSTVVVKLPMKDSNVKTYGFAYNVYGSTDGVNFDRLASMEEPVKATAEGFVFEVSPEKPYRVIRALCTMSTKGSYSSAYISEIEVYGEKTENVITPTREKIGITSYDEWLLEKEGVDLSKIKDENGKYRIEDTFTEEDTIKALEGLVTRVLGEEYVSWFIFDVTEPSESGLDYYEISDKDGKIRIRGNKGVSIATGLNYYLKYFCKVQVSQETKQNRMPDEIVPVGSKIRTETPFEVRYTYNYCTLSYTMPYYGFDEWQKELDYLMLSGINVVLDTTATEALWVLFLQNYGYTAQDALEFVCGYTWKAWWLMGNLEGTGGPVADNWICDTVEMARVNQRYLAVMGADPCLQTFTGTLPTNFGVMAAQTLADQGYPDVNRYLTSTGSWSGFVRPYALNTTFPGFDSLAKKFYEVQNEIYGRIGDYYAGDFLHEISGGFNLDPQFNKANMSREVLNKLIEENDRGVWVIQSWWENPLPEVVAGWGDDREDHMLLLDLAAVQSPRWSNSNNYGGLEFGGSSWCYCILEDYGGREGAHMNLTTLCRNLNQTRKRAEHMKGIGLTSEGTERNPVVFDLFWELAWYPATQASDWIEDYAERRYGGTEAVGAWKALLKNIYNVNSADGTTVNMSITSYPKLDYTGSYYYPSYNVTKFNEALSQLIDCYDVFKDEENYVYDLIELCTTAMANTAIELLGKAATAAAKADYNTFHAIKVRYLQLMMAVDELGAYYENQQLGKWVGRIDTWIRDSRTSEYSDFDVDMMKLDAVMLITNWSTIDLGNYANRPLSGLVEDYYYRMWNNFFTKADDKIRSGSAITDKSSTMGVSNTVTYYNYGREIALAVMNGKRYVAESVPVDGDAYHRSMKDVLEDVRTRFLHTSEVLLNTAALSEGATLTVADGVLSGVAAGDCAADLSAQFVTTEGGKVAFLDGETLISDGEKVSSGMKAVILEDDGSVLDTLALTVGEITVDPASADKAAELASSLATQTAEWKTIDLLRYNTLTANNVARILADADAAVSSGSPTLLAEAAKKAELVKEELEVTPMLPETPDEPTPTGTPVEPTETPVEPTEPTETTEPTEPVEPSRSETPTEPTEKPVPAKKLSTGALVGIICGGVALLAAAAVAVVILLKKKKH